MAADSRAHLDVHHAAGSGTYAPRRSRRREENGVVPDDRQPEQVYFALIMLAYNGSRQVPQGTVGSARAELIDAADLVAFAPKWMTTNLR